MLPAILCLPQGKHILGVSAGECHSLAYDSQGELYAWGCARLGQCGPAHSGTAVEKTGRPAATDDGAATAVHERQLRRCMICRPLRISLPAGPVVGSPESRHSSTGRGGCGNTEGDAADTADEGGNGSPCATQTAARVISVAAGRPTLPMHPQPPKILCDVHCTR